MAFAQGLDSLGQSLPPVHLAHLHWAVDAPRLCGAGAVIGISASRGLKRRAEHYRRRSTQRREVATLEVAAKVTVPLAVDGRLPVGSRPALR